LPDISPLYFTVNSDGTINAVFPGGIEIPEAEFAEGPTPTKAVRWVDQSDGSVAAYIYARKGGTDTVNTEVRSADTEGGQLSLRGGTLETTPGTGFLGYDAMAWLTLWTQRTPRFATIQASLHDRVNNDLYEPVIYDSQGRSAFLQFPRDTGGGAFGPDTRRILIWAGYTNGATITQLIGTGLTCSRPTTGLITLTGFGLPVGKTVHGWAITDAQASGGTGLSHIAAYTPYDNNRFSFLTADGSTNTLTNQSIFYLCLGEDI